ncbi:MAG TPA: NUDIX domain-containing protein [Niabella sp.]|jgi:8-oxo-dGTP diphosphatase|nr:NUDIX domain-containing protein [Chitinophagaceae bacterium]HRN47007.1 NUDIX domain-containing protein [Niabella sp.]HRO84909.1 NUDIX domain-containing protein [Niabella sp.]
MLKYFNVRVYGILINEAKQVLVSDERIYNRNLEITKFPGGGLELGEGTLDCIKREFKEELNIDIEIVKHLYTTDFFQQSAFHDDHQIISIYYIVKPIMPLFIPVNNGLPEYPDKVGEIFRFIDWDFFNEDIMSLPIDKIAVKILKNEY